MLFLVFFVFGSDAGSLVRALTKFSHLTADTIISGSATANMAPTDDADRKSTHFTKLHFVENTCISTNPQICCHRLWIVFCYVHIMCFFFFFFGDESHKTC